MWGLGTEKMRPSPLHQEGTVCLMLRHYIWTEEVTPQLLVSGFQSGAVSRLLFLSNIQRLVGTPHGHFFLVFSPRKTFKRQTVNKSNTSKYFLCWDNERMCLEFNCKTLPVSGFFNSEVCIKLNLVIAVLRST